MLPPRMNFTPRNQKLRGLENHRLVLDRTWTRHNGEIAWPNRPLHQRNLRVFPLHLPAGKLEWFGDPDGFFNAGQHLEVRFIHGSGISRHSNRSSGCPRHDVRR